MNELSGSVAAVCSLCAAFSLRGRRLQWGTEAHTTRENERSRVPPILRASGVFYVPSAPLCLPACRMGVTCR